MNDHLLISFLFLLINMVISQNSWVKEFQRPKQFIENKGQFDEFSSQDFRSHKWICCEKSLFS